MWVLIVSVPDHCLSFYFPGLYIMSLTFKTVAKRQQGFVTVIDLSLCFH